MDKIVRREKLLGSEIILTDDPEWSVYIKWEQQTIGYASRREKQLVLKPDYHVNEAGFFDLTGVFETIDDIFSFVVSYLSSHEDLQQFLRTKHQKEKSNARETIEYGRVERAKQYHLEIADLSPEHNIYYSDLISTRLKNIIRLTEVYTLAELCHWDRKKFKSIRNCGEKTTQELEILLHHTGLDWGTPEATPEAAQTENNSYNDGFKDGYNAAVLAATEWLKEHPYAFTRLDGTEIFQKAMDKGI